MFLFTIRDVLGLTVVAGVSCVLGAWVAPADPVSDMLAAAFLFVFGGTCFVGGIVVARFSQNSN